MQIELRARENGAEYTPFTPELSVRPHHIIEVSTVRAALNRRRNPQLLSVEFMTHMGIVRVMETIPGYSKDVMGTTAKEAEIVREGIEAYFQRLYDLPDEAFIQLDLEKDDLCRSCTHGQHCTATNFQAIDPGRRLVEPKELAHVYRIREDLERAGYRENRDFKTKMTQHTIHDYGGEVLSDEASSVPRDVLFDALIVRVGALRDMY